MNTAEIKIDLFRKIDTLKEKSLYEVYGLLLNFINKEKSIDEWDTLTKKQQEALKLGVHQLDKGEGVAHKTVMQSVRNKFLNGK